MLKNLTAVAATVIILAAACTSAPTNTPAASTNATHIPATTMTNPTTANPPTAKPTPTRATGPEKASATTDDATTPAPRDLMSSLSETERVCLGNPKTLREVTDALAKDDTRNQTIRCLAYENEFELYVIAGEAEKLAKDMAKTTLSRDTKHCMWKAVSNLEDPPPFTSQLGTALELHAQAQKRARFIMLAIPTYCVDVHQPDILEADVANGRLKESDLAEIRTIICTIEQIGGITRWANLFLPHGKPYADAMIPAQEICGVNPPTL